MSRVQQTLKNQTKLSIWSYSTEFKRKLKCVPKYYRFQTPDANSHWIQKEVEMCSVYYRLCTPDSNSYWIQKEVEIFSKCNDLYKTNSNSHWIQKEVDMFSVFYRYAYVFQVQLVSKNQTQIATEFKRKLTCFQVLQICIHFPSTKHQTQSPRVQGWCVITRGLHNKHIQFAATNARL